jgi:hypothetical protein
VPSKKSKAGQDSGAMVLSELRESREFLSRFRFNVIQTAAQLSCAILSGAKLTQMTSCNGYRYHRGYPERYRRELKSSLLKEGLVFVPVILFLGYGTWLNGLRVYHETTVLGWVGLVIFGGLFALFALAFVAYVIRTIHFLAGRGPTYAEIVPYFEREIGLVRSHGSSTLAKNCQQIDQLAIKNGVAALSEFGMDDDLKGRALQWRDPEEGLKTIQALIGATRKNPDQLSDWQEIVTDLERMESALLKAQSQGIRFCLLLRLGDGRVPPGGVDLYEGSFW